MRVIIVEDEAPARLKLKMQLQQLDGVQVIAECAEPRQAMRDINALAPDVVLLDIELGELSGFDVLEAISHPCHVIFTTAYNQYAVKAFEKRALDYLLKPFNLDRLREAFARVVLEHSAGAELPNTQVIAKVGDKIHLLPTSDIYFLRAAQGMVVARVVQRDFHLDVTLESVSQQLPQTFLRVHRKCIVNTQQVSQIEKWKNGTFLLRFNEINDTITTSRRGALAVRKHFGI